MHQTVQDHIQEEQHDEQEQLITDKLVTAAYDNAFALVRELVKLSGHRLDAYHSLDAPQMSPGFHLCGYTALVAAAKNGNTGMVHELEKHGVNMYTCDVYGRSALMLAARYGHTDTVCELLLHRPNVDRDSDSDGDTALILAIRHNHTETVRELLKAGPDLYVTNDDGETAITLAALSGQTEISIMLEAYKSQQVQVRAYYALNCEHYILKRSKMESLRGLVRLRREHHSLVNEVSKLKCERDAAMFEAGKSERERDAAINEVSKLKCERDATMFEVGKSERERGVLMSSTDVILKHFKANTAFANPKDKSFKENQIINLTLDDVISQISNTSLSGLTPVFEHLSQVAANHAHQRIQAKYNDKQINWMQHETHEQFVQPAIDSVLVKMESQQKLANTTGIFFGLRVIVGRGNGSVNNVPKIKNAFLKHLEDNQIEWFFSDPKNDGFVSIVFKPNKAESVDLLN